MADLKRMEENAENARRGTVVARRAKKVGKLQREPGEDEDGGSKFAIRLAAIRIVRRASLLQLR